MRVKIAAIVVTYNRKELLRRALDALLSQSRPADAIFLIDNASSDGTGEMLGERGYLTAPGLEYVRLDTNMGGAGGFREGLNRAMAAGADWAWLMDDDAEPEPEALSALEAVGLDQRCCYGAAAVFQGTSGEWNLCWPAVPARGGQVAAAVPHIRVHDELPEQMEVTGMPFLGFLVGRELVAKAGLPDADYFVSGDDMDYGERLKKAGARLVLVKGSRIRHPRPNDYSVRFVGRSFFCLRMAPWRRYYDIRNRVMNGRRHYGLGLIFMTLPGILVRWVATMRYEPARLRQSVAYARGIIDGLFGRLGRRWEPGA